MSERTAISWCDSTANLWIGCQKVSPACDHCYAEHLMGDGPNDRLKRVHWGRDGERQLVKSGWADVRRWNARAARNHGLDPELGRRRRVFVNSLSDFFDNHRSIVWRDEAWELIRASPHLIFILLTKRPQSIARFLPPFWNEIAERVWLLTTVEDQEWANRRVADLLTSTDWLAPAAVYGLSCEPLLGPLVLHEDWLNGWFGNSLGWVIAGGESGKEARPSDPAWFVGLRDQCARGGIAFQFKQWGEWAPAIGTREGDVIYRHPHPDFPNEWPTVGIGTTVRRVGKTAAGRSLRGLEYLDFPNAS